MSFADAFLLLVGDDGLELEQAELPARSFPDLLAEMVRRADWSLTLAVGVEEDGEWRIATRAQVGAETVQ